MATMRSAAVNGVNLMYEVRGTGEPLVLSHCSFIADAFAPLMDQPALSGYQLIRYHRRGWGGSSHATGPVTMADQAADLAGLLEHLGVRRAHIAGHSSSGFIALQLAADRPDLVGSLALLETPLFPVMAGPPSEIWRQRMAGPLQRFREGDREGATDGILAPLFGPGYRAQLERVLPGSWAQTLRDVNMFFDCELPSMLQWPFGAGDVARVTAPVLSVTGAESIAQVSLIEQQLRSWFPHLETACVPGVNHMMQLQRAQPVAEALAAFLARHPLG